MRIIAAFETLDHYSSNALLQPYVAERAFDILTSAVISAHRPVDDVATTRFGGVRTMSASAREILLGAERKNPASHSVDPDPADVGHLERARTP